MNSWLTAWRGLSRWRLFGVIVGFTAILASLASVLTYRFVLDDSNAAPLRIALIAPISGDEAAIGASMEAGARQALAKVHGVVSGHPIELSVIDEAAPDAAERAAGDSRVVGVIGPYGVATAARAGPAAEAAGLATLSLAPPVPGPGKAFFSVVPPADQEVRFLANYVRNVLGERLVSIILPDDPAAAMLAGQFDEVLQHFGTRVVYRWTIAANTTARDGLRAVAAEIDQKQIAGTVLLLGGPSFTAEALADLRQANVPNRIIGLREMATRAFGQALSASWTAAGTMGAGLNGTVVTTPLLFDTAGIKAQEFRNALTASGAGTADWLAALTHDATAFLAEAISDLPETRREDAPAIRKEMPAAIAAYNRPEHALSVLSGTMYFNGQVAAASPQLAGVYDGTALISSPIQLTPILEEGVSDYLQELKEGRALYVNDRFMYKTNVVYAGVQLEKVFLIDADNNIADAEFLIWFRWRGTLEPQSVVFPNAVAPIDLTKPEHESKTGELNYRAYRVRGKFFMNYSGAPHPYGTQVVDIVFRHRTLGTNNLRYVTDTLGLGLNEAGPAEARPGFLARVFGTTPSGALARQMAASRVLAGVPGWLVDHAWLSQETLQATSRGDPVFVGFGKPTPLFSSIELGLIAKPDAPDPQDAIPSNWLVYGMIFALFGSVLAHVLDRKDRGHFWRMQTLLLRLIAWPLLLLTGKALALAYAQAALSPSMTAGIDMTGSAGWWFLGAWLAKIAVERFIWSPLEASTQRRVPTVFRAIVTILILAVAGFGVVAFVLGKSVTSLLATSGVLTFIIGIAIQSNLKDIFSGIMLNMERPFRIGDFLRVNRNIGQVIDVSWRTTRIRLSTGPVLALPNGRLSDSEIENLSASDKNEANLTIPLDAAYPPEAVLAALDQAMSQVSASHTVKESGLKEITRVGDDWVATYEVRCRVPTYPEVRPFRYEAFRMIWSTLEAAGMPWTGPGGGHFAEAVETSQAGVTGLSRATCWLPACLHTLTVLLMLAVPAAAEEKAAELRGLVFVPDIASFDAHGVAVAAEPVDLSRVPLLNQPGFAARMRALIGQQLTLATLNGIKPLVTAVFEAAGHPAIAVTIPEQDVTSGIVQVVVLEYTVGKIVVEGASHFPQGLYRNAVGTSPGQTVDMTKVQAGLKQLNESQYRSAQVALRPGTDPGTVDVVLRAQDRLPVTVSAGYNNSGAPTTGRNQWTLGATAANTVGNLDDVLSYQFLTSDFQDQAPALVTHSVTYALALPGLGQFSVLGSYSSTRPPVDNFVSSQGRSVQVSPRFAADVFARNDLQVSVRGGYDYKSTNNNLAFGGATITQTAANVSQFELDGILGKGDGWGRTDTTLSLVVSPGGMIPGNDDASFRGLSPAAHAQYGYARLDVTRTTILPASLTLWTHAVGQVASIGLLPSEQLNAGGMGTVRGYAASTVRGDAGLMLSNELRWKGGSVGGWLFGHDIGDRLEPFLFVDYAEVAARRSGTQPASGGTLTSFGPGVRINLDRYMVLTLDAGGQIRAASGRHYPAQFFDVSIGVQF